MVSDVSSVSLVRAVRSKGQSIGIGYAETTRNIDENRVASPLRQDCFDNVAGTAADNTGHNRPISSMAGPDIALARHTKP